MGCRACQIRLDKTSHTNKVQIDESLTKCIIDELQMESSRLLQLRYSKLNIALALGVQELYSGKYEWDVISKCPLFKIEMDKFLLVSGGGLLNNSRCLHLRPGADLPPSLCLEFSPGKPNLTSFKIPYQLRITGSAIGNE